jgi:hypothetical protein
MSALGQKRTSACILAMSALPPKADITPHCGNVCFVPKAYSRAAAIFYCYSISRSARPTSGSVLPVWNVGRISIDKSFKFNAVQQLRAVACLI